MSIKHISNIILITCLLIFIAYFFLFLCKLFKFQELFFETKNNLDIVNNKYLKIRNTSNIILNECRDKLNDIKKMIPWLFLLLAFKRHYDEAKTNNEPKLKYSISKTAKDAIYINNL